MSLFPFVVLGFFFLPRRQTPTAQYQNSQNSIVQSTQAAVVASLNQKNTIINQINFFLSCVHLNLW